MSPENQIPTEWYFITPPQEVDWTKDSNTTEIDTYGTNTPYFNYGTTKLRKLNLGDAMIEGFSMAMEIEGNVRALESCMEMVIDTATGFASPYCWNVFAEGKSYGTYIITSVNVREEMRDTSGKATRAFCDITLQEVSQYQVSSGTDITSQAIVGGVQKKFEDEMANQDKAIGADKKKGTPTSGGAGTPEDNSVGGDTGSPPDAPTVTPVIARPSDEVRALPNG